MVRPLSSRIVLPLLPLALLATRARAQCIEATFPAPGGPTGLYGYSVSIDGSLAAVGDPFDDQAGLNAGAVYLYSSAGSGWREIAKLTASDPSSNAWFGNHVALQGGRLLVGADGADAMRGKAYVFQRQGSNWIEEARLVASDGAADDRFAWGLALDGNRSLLGAFGNGAGAAYVFERGPGGWSQVQKLTSSDSPGGGWFGVSVALSGDAAVIGAMEDDSGGVNVGSAYFFERHGGTWSEVNKVGASDPSPLAYFGNTVAIEGRRALIAAYKDQNAWGNAGTVYVFERGASTWVETARLVANDGEPNGDFGVSVVLQGEQALIGASGTAQPGGGEGVAYLFELAGGTWIQLGQVLAPGHTDFGISVDFAGERALISALPSAAYVFRIPAFATPYCFCGTGAPCGNADPTAGCTSTAGHGGLLTACGSASVAADDLTLAAERLIAGTPAVLFVARDPVNGGAGAPFDNGLLCASGDEIFFEVRSASAAGTAQWGPGLGASGGWGAGDLRRFQAWYRDPHGPCGETTNLSNGIEAVFGP